MFLLAFCFISLTFYSAFSFTLWMVEHWWYKHASSSVSPMQVPRDTKKTNASRGDAAKIISGARLYCAHLPGIAWQRWRIVARSRGEHFDFRWISTGGFR